MSLDTQAGVQSNEEIKYSEVKFKHKINPYSVRLLIKLINTVFFSLTSSF